VSFLLSADSFFTIWIRVQVSLVATTGKQECARDLHRRGRISKRGVAMKSDYAKAADAELLTPSDVSKMGGIVPSTVRYWATTKQLAVIRTAGGIRLFRRQDVIRFLRERAEARRG
jgi:Helix-turn-helix domain